MLPNNHLYKLTTPIEFIQYDSRLRTPYRRHYENNGECSAVKWSEVQKWWLQKSVADRPVCPVFDKWSVTISVLRRPYWHTFLKSTLFSASLDLCRHFEQRDITGLCSTYLHDIYASDLIRRLIEFTLTSLSGRYSNYSS